MMQSKNLFVGLGSQNQLSTGEKRCPSIDKIMSVCIATETIYVMETIRSYTE